VKSWLKQALPLLLATTAAVLLASCDEQLEGGAACPALCPQPRATTVRDTTFFAVELDTSLAGFPALGTEAQFFIASLGDTLQTRGIVRFDSLPLTFRHNNSAVDSNIVFVDTGAYVRLSLVRPDTLGAPTTVEVYDVDLDGAEEADPTAVGSAFTANRLLGSRTIPADSLRDSVRVPINSAKLLAKIQGSADRLRIGLRVTRSGGGSARITVVATNGSPTYGKDPPILVFRPSTDTTVSPTRMSPRSVTPAEAFVAADLADYLVVTKAPPDPPSNVIRVGGLPGRRAYFRFNIPSRIIDSSNVVRATLLLTQRPNGFSPGPRDSVAIEQFTVTAGPAVKDLSRALLFLTTPSKTDSTRLVAADSGTRSLELISLVRAWRTTSPDRTPRALALRTTTESLTGGQLDFFSMEAPVAVRPRLRLTYLPQQVGGLP
jgi:hypothetical protein